MAKRRMRTKRTGSLWKPKNSRFYWAAHTNSEGTRIFESTKKEDIKEAQDFLADRIADAKRGVLHTTKTGRRTLVEGLQDVIDDLKLNGRRSIEHTQRRIDLHITPFFGERQLMNPMKERDLTRYVTQRMDEGAAAASINHELAIIRRAFRLAFRREEVNKMPHIPMLAVSNTRQGFFERHQLEAILEHLPKFLHAPVWFAYASGWRWQSEVLALRSHQVDLRAGTVTLAAGETKNGDAREIRMTKIIRRVMEEQLSSIAALKKAGTLCTHVFHLPNGSEIKNYRDAWKAACLKAGYPGKLFHDFRRTAVRNNERAGVPRSVAMKMVGHRTESIYKRYAITDAAMLAEAAAKQDAFEAAQAGNPHVGGGQVHAIS